MRKQTCVNYFLLIFCLPFTLMGQSNGRFIAELIHDNNIEQELDKYFTEYVLVQLPANEIEAFLQQSEPYFSIHWAFPNDIVWDMTLEAAPILSDDFELQIQDETQKRRLLPIDRTKLHTFKAREASEEHRLTVHGNFIYGYTIQNGQEWYIEPIKRFAPNTTTQAYVVYKNRDVRPIPNLECGANDKDKTPNIETLTGNGRDDACYEVELAIAADYSMFEFYGTVEDVFVQLEGVMNNVAGNFDTEFSDEIYFKISEMVISICDSCDPWMQSTEAGDLLVDFHEWGISDLGFTHAFDLAQFWTRRPLEENGNGSVIGLAFVGTVCTDNRFHVLEDFSASAGHLRVLAAHEIGHNFGCIHNYDNTDFSCFTNGHLSHIMDPSVSNTSLWSDGSSSTCSANSLLRVQNMLASNNCLSNCGEDCGVVSNVQADFDPYMPTLHLDWFANGEQVFRVRIRDLEKNVFEDFFTNENSIDLDASILELCTQYEVLIDIHCDDHHGRSMSVLFNTEAESLMDIANIQTRNCQVATNTYDLDLYIEYDEVFEEGFTISIGEQIYEKNYTSSPQFVKIQNLHGDGRENIEVIVQSKTYTSIGCAARATYQAPNLACSFKVEADFDDCKLPPGWSLLDTYGAPTPWGVADSTRLVINFMNESGNTTINGSCMAYFDDDILGPGEMSSGTANLFTPIMDLKDYETVNVSLVYNFNAYFTHPNSSFLIDVFDGNEWINILTDNTGSGCPPNDAWKSSCNTYFAADLSPFANGLLRLRFSYSDGGRWAEFIAIDDFILSATKDASLLPVELVQFSAKTEGKNVALNWSTAQEINNDFFEIERSGDGRNFTPIGQVSGLDYSQEKQFYNYIDNQPQLGINYYRLRQVDEDGTYAYSKIVSATIDSDEKWRVYPNPIVDGSAIFIERFTGTANAAEYQLFNTNGQLMANYVLPANQVYLSVNMNNFPSGMYTMREIGGESVKLVR